MISDLVCATDSQLKIMLNQEGAFLLSKSVDLPGSANQIDVSDLNRDGQKEIVIAKDDAVAVAKDDPSGNLYDGA
jgi:hypothetical protein